MAARLLADQDAELESLDIEFALTPQLIKRFCEETRRNKARCVYWKAKGLLAHGDCASARIGASHAHNYVRAVYETPLYCAR